MAALALFLCAVLAELVSLSLSEITIGSTEVYCPDSICMFIDNRLCCGVAAHGPKAAPQSVKVTTTINSDFMQSGGRALVIAGFQDKDYHHENSVPTCYDVFEWPATARKLKFTESPFALEYYPDGYPIIQLFSGKADKIHCPSNPEEIGLMKSPYYDPARISDEKSEIPLQDSPYQFKAAGIETSPISFIAPSSSRPGVPIIADSSINPPVIPPSSDPSNYIEPSLSNMATKPNTDLDAFGFTGGDCAGDGCDGASSIQQYNQGFLDGVKLIRFRA